MNNKNQKPNIATQFITFTAEAGNPQVEVRIENEMIWLTQKKIAELFETSVPNINMHLTSIFDDGELDEKSVIQEFLITATDGKTYKTMHYNLDAIIAVGYRVNSKNATQFRIWATGVLRDFMIKGFVMDDELLKNGTRFGKDYFDELLERIRDIRASERRFYQKITDIYATAIDYDASADITQTFFKTVQNKLHFAIHGKTAAELIANRASAEKPNMGLTTWKGSPDNKILKTDVSVGKNYLAENEIKELNRIVTMYLDYAENQAERGRPMKMADWVEKLDGFLQFNEYEILDNPGKVSMEAAKKLAEDEYQKFAPIQDQNFRSDFDEFVDEVKKLEGEK